MIGLGIPRLKSGIASQICDSEEIPLAGAADWSHSHFSPPESDGQPLNFILTKVKKGLAWPLSLKELSRPVLSCLCIIYEASGIWLILQTVYVSIFKCQRAAQLPKYLFPYPSIHSPTSPRTKKNSEGETVLLKLIPLLQPNPLPQNLSHHTQIIDFPYISHSPLFSF